VEIIILSSSICQGVVQAEDEESGISVKITFNMQTQARRQEYGHHTG